MRDQQRLWRAYRVLAARELGQGPGQPRVMQSQARMGPHAAAALRLPAADMGESLYDEDGNLKYMADFDGLDQAPLA